MPSAPFTALHCHSMYSLLDGACSVEALVTKVVEQEQSALAITDHGNMHAAWHFQKMAKKHGIKPILGMEAYVAPGSRHDRGRGQGERNYHHLIVLARDAVGYKNLCTLTSRSFNEGFYMKPRIDRELLTLHGEGLIITSACMAGEVARALEADNWDAAREAASWYANEFPDRYYLEVQAHGTPGQKELNAKIFRLADDLGLPVVATNDSHFMEKGDHRAHDALCCIGLGKDLSDPDRLHYDEGLYFKSAKEMQSAFPNHPEVLANTMVIADAVNLSFAKQYHVPNFPVPAAVRAPLVASGVTTQAAIEAQYLRQLVATGLRARYGHLVATPETPLPAHVLERAEFELSVIETAGYCGYFLIVSDFLGYARSQGIPVGPGRGSAAGSIVAYATEITDVCPLTYDLLFERFLNPSRVSMPDVDCDFDMERRAEVIEYVREKYGRDAVAQIATFGTLKSRAALTDVGRVLGFSPREQKAVASLVPNAPGVVTCLADAEAIVPALQEMASEKGEKYAEWLSIAKKLEGLARHIGVHAAGIVIAPGPVSDYVPTCTVATKGAGAAADGTRSLVTQYEMGPLEDAGMLKMDFLGLKTLTICHYALQAIQARHGVAINLRTLPLDDPTVYAMLARGDTAGVFQFESSLATDTLRQMKVDCFEDLVASNALLRPGPLDAGMHLVYIRRKLGQEPVRYLLPELEQVLAKTWGVFAYQEQVMKCVELVAGFSLAEADVLRKAVGKKDAKMLGEELGKFVERACAKGHDPLVIEELASQIATFGQYGFNRSHAVAYSVISYHTAYLKHHYAAEYWAAVLTAELGDKNKVIRYMGVARAAGITLQLPDVNESSTRFAVIGEGAAAAIRFPLASINGVGATAAAAVIDERAAHGPFTTFADFIGRVAQRKVSRLVIQALIEAGALDGLPGQPGTHRAQLAASLDALYSYSTSDAKARAQGQGSLFDLLEPADAVGMVPGLVPTAPWPDGERLAREHRGVGCFLSGHPLESLADLAGALRDRSVSELATYTEEKVLVPAVVIAVEKKNSKRTGNAYAMVTVEDLHGQATIMVFSDTLAALEAEGLLEPLTTLLLVGGFSDKDADSEEPRFMLDYALRLERAWELGLVQVRLELPMYARQDAGPYLQVPGLLQQHAGRSPLVVRRLRETEAVFLDKVSRFAVRHSPALASALRSLLGPSSVVVTRDLDGLDSLRISARRRRAA